MAEVLQVELRERLGTANCRRMRRAGQVPANLYGHGEDNLNLIASADDVATVIRQGAKVLDLQGAVKDSALIREVQWDAFGIDVLHLDLTRVSADERVRVSVTIELRGVAPGSREGGKVEHHLHEVDLECPVNAIPDKFELNINELHLNETLTLKELQLPPGATLFGEVETVVAACVEVAEELEEEEVEAGTDEPEVIGRKPDEEGESQDS